MASATIALNGNLSGAVDLGIYQPGNKIVGFIMPSGWDAAALTFQVCDTVDGTFVNLYDDNNTEVSLSAAASRAIGLRKDQSDVLGRWRFIKVRSGPASSPVTQTVERIIKIVVK